MKKSLLFLSCFFVALLFVNDITLAQEFETGNIAATLNDYGRLRVWAPDLNTKIIERFSALVGGAADQAFDYKNDADTELAAELVAAPTLGDFELFVSANNAYSLAPPDFIVDLRVYGWTGSSYVIVKFTVKNNEATALDSYLGAEIVPGFGDTYGEETVEYLSDSQVVQISKTGYDFVGFYSLSHDLVTVKSIDYVNDYFANDADLYGWLTTGTLEQTFTAVTVEGLVSFLGFGTAHLEPGASTDYYVAVSVGADQAAMLVGITEAQAMFTDFPTSVEQVDAVPTSYSLTQNYPNPFNPTTNINFSIPKTEFVSLKVYNMLGQEVAELVNSELTAGTYSIDFKAENISSGIYMYTLTSGNYSVTKKMMLVK